MLLGFLFLQSVIASHIPKSDKSPLLSSFLVGSLVLSGFNVVAVSLLGEVYNAGEKTGPRQNSTIRRFLERFFAAQILHLFTLCTPSTCTRLVRSFRRRSQLPPCRHRSRNQRVSLRFPASEIDLHDNENDELREASHKWVAPPLPIAPRDYPEHETEPSPAIPQRDSTRVDGRFLPPNGAVSIGSEEVTEARIESVQSTELTIGIPFRGPKNDRSSVGLQSSSSIAPIRLIQMSDEGSAISPRPPHLSDNNTCKTRAASRDSVPERENREDEQPHKNVGTEQVTQVEANEDAAKEENEVVWHYFALLLDRLHCIVYIVAQLLLVVVYLHPIWDKRRATLLKSETPSNVIGR